MIQVFWDVTTCCVVNG